MLVDPQFGVTTFVHLIELQDELAQLLGSPVDVVTPGGLRKPVADRISQDMKPL